MAKQIWKPGNMLYPLPAVMVSVADKEGNPNIITVAWAGTVCTNPPMVSISVRPERYSYHMIDETGEFVINLTTEKLVYATDYCGVRSGKDVDKFKELHLTPEKAEYVSAPLIAESPVNIECKVVKKETPGSHHIFLAEWKEQELKANGYGKENIETSKELDQMLESEKEELPAENNPLADIVDIQAQALLNLVSTEGFTLSSKAVKSEETVSNRKLRQGYGTMKEKDNGAGDTIFFNLYLIDKFGNAANKKKNTVLDYEMEYLLGGKASDKDNLEYVIGRIRILRFAVNYGYLLTDKDMQMEVDTLATTLSAVFLSPEIGPVIKHALLLAWAYGESLTDVKTLLAGKKVPAVKSKESWNLTLDGLLELAKNRSIPEGKETEEGNSYEQYLQMMLVLKSKEELSMRALDLVEMNLRSGMEKTFFRADACVSGADFDMTCYLRRGIRYQYHILYQYQ